MGYANNGSTQVGGGFGNRQTQTVRNHSTGGADGENIDDLPNLARFCLRFVKGIALVFVIAFGLGGITTVIQGVASKMLFVMVGGVCLLIFAFLSYMFITSFARVCFLLVLAFYRLYKKKMSQM